MKRKPSEIELNSQKRIKLLIESRCGGSQQIFADRVGIGKSSVSQYVNGTNFPTNVRAKQIADIFGVSPMWIMGFDVPMIEEPEIKVYDLGTRYAPQLVDAYRKSQFLSKYAETLERPIVQDLVSATVGCTDSQIEIAKNILETFKAPSEVPTIRETTQY